MKKILFMVFPFVSFALLAMDDNKKSSKRIISKEPEIPAIQRVINNQKRKTGLGFLRTQDFTKLIRAVKAHVPENKK